MKLVEIKWKDAVSSSDWFTEQEAKEFNLSLNLSVGWIITDTSEYITIVSTISLDSSSEDKYSEITCIPKHWIVNMNIIKEEKC